MPHKNDFRISNLRLEGTRVNNSNLIEEIEEFNFAWLVNKKNVMILLHQLLQVMKKKKWMVGGMMNQISWVFKGC